MKPTDLMKLTVGSPSIFSPVTVLVRGTVGTMHAAVAIPVGEPVESARPLLAEKFRQGRWWSDGSGWLDADGDPCDESGVVFREPVEVQA